jgi:hypothetical protein
VYGTELNDLVETMNQSLKDRLKSLDGLPRA